MRTDLGTRGFTLLEVMIVVAILAIVAATAVPMLRQCEDDALARVARAELGLLRETCLRWKADLGAFPASLAELRRDAAPASLPAPLQTWDPHARRGWRGPYLASGRDGSDGAHLCDPWDDPSSPARRRFYDYVVSGGRVTITSAGPDGERGNADDVSETFP